MKIGKVLAGIAVALAPAAFWLAAFAAGETLTVVKKDAVLRKAPKFYAAKAAGLEEGQAVTLVATDKGWHQVKTSSGEVGWVHDSAVSVRGRADLSTSNVGNVSESERALAGKGFNAQIEGEYRNQRPNLNAAFGEVDAIEGLKIEGAEVEAFLKEGKLGEFAR